MLRALRVSRLTICPLGQPEKAIGLEPQIEPWLAIYNHTACLRQKSMGLVYVSAMNLRKRKITDPPLYELGWIAGRISSLPPVAGEVFLLTSPFIERAYRASEIGGLGTSPVTRHRGQVKSVAKAGRVTVHLPGQLSRQISLELSLRASSARFPRTFLGC